MEVSAKNGQETLGPPDGILGRGFLRINNGTRSPGEIRDNPRPVIQEKSAAIRALSESGNSSGFEKRSLALEAASWQAVAESGRLYVPLRTQVRVGRGPA